MFYVITCKDKTFIDSNTFDTEQNLFRFSNGAGHGP